MENIERIAAGEDVIDEFNDVGALLEQGEQYYDSLGLSLSMAILNDNVIVLSSKHWLRNCYIEIQQVDDDKKFVFGLWDILTTVSRNINRELDRNDNETKFVYISKLNRDQTQKVYEAIIEEIEDRRLDFDVVERYNFFGWNVNEENTVKIPWVVGLNWD